MRGSQGSFQGKEGVFSKPCRQPGVILVRLETGRVKREGVQLTFSHALTVWALFPPKTCTQGVAGSTAAVGGVPTRPYARGLGHALTTPAGRVVRGYMIEESATEQSSDRVPSGVLRTASPRIEY